MIWRSLFKKLLCVKLPSLRQKKTASKSTLTAGLVGELTHQTLPTISPEICAFLTLLAMAPALYKTFSKFSLESWLTSYCSCALASFLFGWHVHEKAILLVIVPMTGLIFIQSSKYFRPFIILSTAGLSGLLPLIYTQFEQVSVTSDFLGNFWEKLDGRQILLRKTGRATNFSPKTGRVTNFRSKNWTINRLLKILNSFETFLAEIWI